MSEAKRKTLTFAAVVVGWVCTVLIAAWSGGATAKDVENKVDAAAKRAEDHEARIRAMESSLGGAVADIRWIRDALGRIEKKLLGQTTKAMIDEIDIAQAIVDELNSGDFSLAIQAERDYLPTKALETMGVDPIVLVAPAGDTAENLTRKHDLFTVQTQIGVLRRFDRKPARSDLDPLMKLVLEIRQYFRKRALKDFPGMTCTRHASGYSDDHLERLLQFSNVITLTHRGAA